MNNAQTIITQNKYSRDLSTHELVVDTDQIWSREMTLYTCADGSVVADDGATVVEITADERDDLNRAESAHQ